MKNLEGFPGDGSESDRAYQLFTNETSRPERYSIPGTIQVTAGHIALIASSPEYDRAEAAVNQKRGDELAHRSAITANT